MTAPGIPGHVHLLRTISLQHPVRLQLFFTACSGHIDIASVAAQYWLVGPPRAWYLPSEYRWLPRCPLVEHAVIGAHAAGIVAICSELQSANANSFDWSLCHS